MGYGGSALGACGTFSQILVFFVNTVLFSGSVLLVTVSVLLLLRDNAIFHFIDVNNPNQVAYIGICLGSVTAFITFFGCAGSCSQSKFIIKLYLVMMLILFILFLTIILMGFLYQNRLKGNLTNGMTKSLTEIQQEKVDINGNNTQNSMQNWNDMQEKFECCGMNDWTDWEFEEITIKSQNDDSNRTKREALETTESVQFAMPEYISQERLNKLPVSCFKNETITDENLYKVGCRDMAKDSLQSYVTLFLIASGSVAIVLVFSICISLWLLRSVRKSLAFN